MSRMLFVVSGALANLAFAGAFVTPSLAQEGENYTISGNDGYGIVECMHTGSDCGRLIADSWCEAHGHAHALAYGAGQDLTGAISNAAPVVKIAAGDVVIRCGD